MSATWKQVELRICRMWGGERTGPVGRNGPDCKGVPVAIQVKYTSSASSGIYGRWIDQAVVDAERAGKPYVLVVVPKGSRRQRAVVDHQWLVWLAAQAGLIPERRDVDQDSV